MSDSPLARALIGLDRQQYGAYKRVGRTDWVVDERRIPVTIRIEHVQGDPFASPSRLQIDLPPDMPDLPEAATDSTTARRATADFLHRALRRRLQSIRPPRDSGGGRGRGDRGGGSGKSGRIEIAPLGQEVLDRTALTVEPDGHVRVRLTVGLPAAGRRILGRAAAELLTRTLPDALHDALDADNLDEAGLLDHVRCVEDQVAMRAQLEAQGLVAFLAADAVLARRSGVDDRPMPDAVPFEVPDALAVTLDAPHAGPLHGLGVRSGVTLLVGGGYHGKSTVLDALARGVYDHVPGDGRDRCVTVGDAVCVRAEDGRAVRGVDLRPFINGLPMGRPTDRFDTDDASGSTSQAAAIVEAIEAGARVLLIDEDTAATNFMIRDARMRRLVPGDREPITPFLDRVQQLSADLGVSSVLVVGGAGDYLDVADTVILMDAYRPFDRTEAARAVADEMPLAADAAPAPPSRWPTAAPRVPDPRSLDPSRGRKRERVRSVRTRAIEFGDDEIDVSLVAQLVDPAQCRMVGDALLSLSRGLCDGRRSIPELLDAIETRLDADGLEAVCEPTFGDRARARRHEIAAALNRLRSLRATNDRGDAR
jgi:predicted ABC-class ATPase